jgi:hypothetical protein
MTTRMPSASGNSTPQGDVVSSSFSYLYHDGTAFRMKERDMGWHSLLVFGGPSRFACKQKSSIGRSVKTLRPTRSYLRTLPLPLVILFCLCLNWLAVYRSSQRFCTFSKLRPARRLRRRRALKLAVNHGFVDCFPRRARRSGRCPRARRGWVWGTSCQQA